MTRILAINGSYRDDGFTDRAVEAAVQAVEAAGAEVEVVLLREYPIGFCLNCRECTQQPATRLFNWATQRMEELHGCLE